MKSGKEWKKTSRGYENAEDGIHIVEAFDRDGGKVGWLVFLPDDQVEWHNSLGRVLISISARRNAVYPCSEVAH